MHQRLYDQSKLPEGDATEEKPEPKELVQEVPIPKTQADLGVGVDNNPNPDSGDLERSTK